MSIGGISSTGVGFSQHQGISQLQQQIAAIPSSVDQVIEKTESQISKLQDLKKGMMQELLTKGIGHTQFKTASAGKIPKQWEFKDFQYYADAH